MLRSLKKYFEDKLTSHVIFTHLFKCQGVHKFVSIFFHISHFKLLGIIMRMEKCFERIQ